MSSEVLDLESLDRTVIVTGGGGGLGRAIAYRLFGDGFRCVIADKNGAALSDTISFVGGSQAARAVPVVCDLREPDDRSRLVATAIAQPGSLFGLVNCAGVAVADALLDESLTDWHETIGVNLEAAFFLSQQAIEHMRRARAGRIINISSVYGFLGFNNLGYGSRAPTETPDDRGPVRQSAYAASKGGLIQLTRDLAAAVGRWNITVNAVSPGTIPHTHGEREEYTGRVAAAPVATRQKARLGDRVDPMILESLASQVPLQRLGDVDEVAGPVSFLLSDDATYITGNNIVVDGGWSIW